MSTDTHTVTEHVDALGYKFEQHDDGDITLVFGTDHYRNADDRPKGVGLVVRVEDAGRHLTVRAPGLYRVPTHREVEVAQVALHLTSRLRLVRVQHDRERLSLFIDLPLSDAPLGREQLRRCLGILISIVDEFHGVWRLALDEGLVDPEVIEHPELAREVDDDLREMLDLFPAVVLEEAAARARARGND